MGRGIDHGGSVWAYLSARELSAALQAREISALEVLDYTIARIEALDGRLNSVVVRDFERARTAAIEADIALGRGDRRPLLGIPMTFKEAFNIAGLPTTWGIPKSKDFVPQEDALVVSRLKRAGAIALGKTNIPMGLGDFQSYNEIYGTTNNPWDIRRTPGGSSGGSAAALAAGFGPLSFGSDIGGSLRMPAHCCGIYAHKPSLGLFPLRGYSPPPPRPPVLDNADLAVVGPMARSAADLAMVLEAVAGPDEVQAGIGYRLTLPPPRHDDLKSFRVLVIDNHPIVPTGDAVRSAMSQLAGQLVRKGLEVSDSNADLPSLSDSARLYMRLLGSARSAGLPHDHYMEAQRQVAALSPQDLSLQAERARGMVASHRDWLLADVTRARLHEQWRRFFGEWDVVLYPAAAVPAFEHDHSASIETRLIEIDGKAYSYYDACYVWADPASTCGLPATAVPIGHSRTGLPIGVQIIGPYLEDRTTIAFAELLERELNGFVAPPEYVR